MVQVKNQWMCKSGYIYRLAVPLAHLFLPLSLLHQGTHIIRGHDEGWTQASTRGLKRSDVLYLDSYCISLYETPVLKVGQLFPGNWTKQCTDWDKTLAPHALHPEFILSQKKTHPSWLKPTPDHRKQQHTEAQQHSAPQLLPCVQFFPTLPTFHDALSPNQSDDSFWNKGRDEFKRQLFIGFWRESVSNGFKVEGRRVT